LEPRPVALSIGPVNGSEYDLIVIGAVVIGLCGAWGAGRIPRRAYAQASPMAGGGKFALTPADSPRVMGWRPGGRTSVIGNRLIDELIDAYVAWHEHCDALAERHRYWLAAPLEDGARGCASYLSALDQEESAALAYQAACDRLVRFMAGAV
jgi:hypothetical protein